MVDRGAIRFHDAVQTALDSGLYRFGVSVGGSAQTDWIRAERFVSVEAPRYRIEESDLFAAQPMPGSRTEVTGQIPWVALRRRTLPWERRGAVADQSVPWLALIVTRAAEASLLDAADLRSIVGATAADRFGTAPAGPFAGLVFPSSAALLALVPTPAETRLLAHVREVSLTDTELGGEDDDGWVAVVVANRVLQGTQEETWRATLVSLEHRGDIAAGQPETTGLLALATWTFADVAGVSFQQSLAALHVGLFGEPSPNEPAGVLLDRADRTGTVAPVRYRSPLTTVHSQPAPVPVDSDQEAPPDVTLLAARQLGRLLAAADGRLVAELIKLRQTRLTRAAMAVTRRFASSGEPAAPVVRALRHLVRRAENPGPAGIPVRPARPTRIAPPEATGRDRPAPRSGMEEPQP